MAFSSGTEQDLAFNPGVAWTTSAKLDANGFIFIIIFNLGHVFILSIHWNGWLSSASYP
jgi:hypothetical protein